MVRCSPGVFNDAHPLPHCLQKGPLDLIETGKGLKVQTDKPHLVSLGSGRLSTAITLLPLEEGKCRQGCSPAPSILTWRLGPCMCGALLPAVGNGGLVCLCLP
jgi:hypothetical protein